jgi:DNA-binding MarR family transcriptional regulator
MRINDQAAAIVAIQRFYPQIYLACHVHHVRAASTVHRLSARDSWLLVHLSPTEPLGPGDLAAHMGVGASTLSAAIGRLAALGYLRRESSPGDRRAAALTLTAQGAKVIAATSVPAARARTSSQADTRRTQARFGGNGVVGTGLATARFRVENEEQER